jgi:YidC/Oxa1 family membrane protein insertase
MKHMRPVFEELRARLAHKPEAYTRELVALHKSHGLSLIDGRSLLGALVQIPVFVGMFHVLRGIGEGVRFLWSSNLIKPDTFLAVIAGITTALMIAANPDMPEQTRLLMILIPSIIAVMTALHFSSALALYWTTSNAFSMVQTLTLQSVVNRQIQKGTLRI